MRPTRVQLLQARVDDWRAYMQIKRSSGITVHIEDVRPLSRAHGHGDCGLALTVGDAENKNFRIIVDPRLYHKSPARFVQTIVHELVHVYSFSTVGDDPRENMELVTDQCAQLIMRLREWEQRKRKR